MVVKHTMVGPRDGLPPHRGVILGVKLRTKSRPCQKPTVLLVKSLGGSVIHIGQRLAVVKAWQGPGKSLLPSTLDRIHGVGCHQEQCQVAQDAMNFGPKGHVNTRHRNSHALHLQRQDSTNADLQALLEAARRTNYHVISLQETKSRKTDVRQDQEIWIRTPEQAGKED
ncbi:unnamed protein product [Strongylus vulgaris]|uniref:Endonuclease/exonuclease/phosphatase domain-containing protein n=1 Tax=Strongylus vulgaris TaxID=40348 RepID=A0A3P7ID27_STRVU|nr:unnamed protein product [Strongylus vulgaris]